MTHSSHLLPQLSKILLLDKAAGNSSFAALAEVKKLYNSNKAGHGGTLDPLATGLLLVFLDESTRFSGYSLDQHKTYETTFRLGLETNTYDIDGEVIKEEQIDVSFAKIEKIVKKMLTYKSQIPPMYSAIKKNGVPLYKLARENKTVELAPRTIEIFSAELLSDASDLPNVKLKIKCSKGTYIRSLAMKFGEELGTVGTVTTLRRLAVGDLGVEYAFGIEDLQKLTPEQRNIILHPADIHIKYFPEIEISREETLAFMNGAFMQINFEADFDYVRLIDKELGFMGIAEPTNNGTALKSKRMFTTDYITKLIDMQSD